MNYGGVYVASVAVHFSYAQVLRAFIEADSFQGPSVVLAYAPKVSRPISSGSNAIMNDTLAALKETKLAVDQGYWPLYRWNPLINVSDISSPFTLDSEKLKKELRIFLERENHLALLVKKHPEISPQFSLSADMELARAVEAKVKLSYQAMLGNLNSKPILILYGSDGGNAEGAGQTCKERI